MKERARRYGSPIECPSTPEIGLIPYGRLCRAWDDWDKVGWHKRWCGIYGRAARLGAPEAREEVAQV